MRSPVFQAFTHIVPDTAIRFTNMTWSWMTCALRAFLPPASLTNGDSYGNLFLSVSINEVIYGKRTRTSWKKKGKNRHCEDSAWDREPGVFYASESRASLITTRSIYMNYANDFEYHNSYYVYASRSLVAIRTCAQDDNHPNPNCYFPVVIWAEVYCDP